MATIDNRGLNCPEPLIKTRKAMEENSEIVSIVDNKTALENILKFARKNGIEATPEKKGDDYYITLKGKDVNSKAVAENDDNKDKNESEDSDYADCTLKGSSLTYLITSDEMGRGSSELGQLLMKNLIYTLTQTEKKPDVLIFLNSGVKLCVEGSKVLDDLDALTNHGTNILVCGTCLDYYNVKDKLSAGQISNMYDIADVLAITDVVTL